MGEGSEFFDGDGLSKGYQAHRHHADSPNESIEKPIFWEMLGNVGDKKILDLGCGDAVFGLELLNAGARSYLGVEASLNMVQTAQQVLQKFSSHQKFSGHIEHATIEAWEYPINHFDLVISRLALHYVANLDDTFGNVNATLKANGRFVFSILHPVITSCDRSRKDKGVRQDWIVDDYFAPGSRQVFFMGKTVEQYHRTIEDIFRALQNSNFIIEQLRESRPKVEQFVDAELYERRKRIPLFLFFSGRKK